MCIRDRVYAVYLVDDVHIYATCIGTLSRCRVDAVVVTLDSSCGYACLLECLDAVSYTHLDVYKRQA